MSEGRATFPGERWGEDEGLTAGLVVVHVDALQLQVGRAGVLAGGVDAVLAANDLPELGADLVTALAGLDVDDLSHYVIFFLCLAMLLA